MFGPPNEVRIEKESPSDSSHSFEMRIFLKDKRPKPGSLLSRREAERWNEVH